VARHRTPEEKRELGERARSLRAEGRSRREIRQELGISDDLAKAFLSGVPVPDSLRRPRAKDDVRGLATAMRAAGCSYDEIAGALEISKSTCSLWLRNVPRPAVAAAPPPVCEPLVDELVEPAAAPADAVELRREEARRLRVEGLLLAEIAQVLGVSTKTVYYDALGIPVPERGRPKGRSPEDLRADLIASWGRRKEARRVQRESAEAHYADAVGPVDRDQLHLMAVTAYWCEGTKSKPWAVREQVTFINSDVGLIRLWLAYLDDIAFPDEHRKFSIAIHESADVAAAERSWADDLGLPVERLLRPTLKRHNPTTVRLNTGDQYRGCLIVRLTQCADLYRRIAGTWAGIMGSLPFATSVADVG
jgi:hypothetical protein